MNYRKFVAILFSVLSGVCFGLAISTFLMANGYLDRDYSSITSFVNSVPSTLITIIIVVPATIFVYEGLKYLINRFN